VAKTLAILVGLPSWAAALHLSGMIENGRARLDPALLLEKGVAEAPEPGPYTLRILDSSGAELASMPFAASTAYAMGEGACRRIDDVLSLTVPLTDHVSARMAEVRVLRGDQELGALRSTAWRPAKVTGEVQWPAPVLPGREPKAVALANGRVRLTWDHAVHPQVLLKGAEGDIRGFFQGGSAELATGSRTLDLDLQDGLRRLPWRVQVGD
jgi:hypothetical protein